MQDFLIQTAMEVAKEPVQSLVEDRTQWKSKSYSDRTDDLHLTLRINASRKDGVENIKVSESADEGIYDMLGRKVNLPSQQGVYIQNGKKIIR